MDIDKIVNVGRRETEVFEIAPGLKAIRVNFKATAIDDGGPAVEVASFGVVIQSRRRTLHGGGNVEVGDSLELTYDVAEVLDDDDAVLTIEVTKTAPPAGNQLVFLSYDMLDAQGKTLMPPVKAEVENPFAKYSVQNRNPVPAMDPPVFPVSQEDHFGDIPEVKDESEIHDAPAQEEAHGDSDEAKHEESEQAHE